MIPLFTDVASGNQNVSIPPQWEYVSKLMIQNVSLAQAFWKDNPKSLKQNQFLIRLLETLGVSMDLPLERYYAYVDAKALTHSMVHRMTSSLYKGHAFHGVFFSPDNTEFLIATDESFNVQDVHERWKDISAIHFLTHPKSDLSLVIPSSNQYSDESGLSIAVINISMLAVQYRAFMLEQAQDTEGGQTTQMFIERYVLPNMLPSQTEQVLFNRLVKIIKREETLVSVNQNAKSPFYLNNFASRLDRVLHQVVENYGLIDGTFEKILANTPALYSTGLSQALLLPDVAMTMQIEWLLIVARLKAFDFLLTVSGERAAMQNQLEISQLLRAFRNNSVFNMIDNNLPFMTRDQIQLYIAHVLQTANKKTY